MMQRNELRLSSRAAAILSLLLAGALASPAAAQQVPQAPGRSSIQAPQQRNPVLNAYQRALQGFLPADARARLQAIDTSSVESGRYQALAFIAGDRAVRQYAAAALDAAGRPFEAGELRQIATFSDQAGADRALDKIGTVLVTVSSIQRPDRKLTAAIASLRAARESLTHAKQVGPGTEMGVGQQQGRGTAGAAAIPSDRQASLHAQRAVRASARCAQQAITAGTDTNHVADLVVQSFTDMVAAARPPSEAATPQRSPQGNVQPQQQRPQQQQQQQQQPRY